MSDTCDVQAAISNQYVQLHVFMLFITNQRDQKLVDSIAQKSMIHKVTKPLCHYE